VAHQQQHGVSCAQRKNSGVNSGISKRGKNSAAASCMAKIAASKTYQQWHGGMARIIRAETM